jgi:hypothetical protein
MLTKLFLGVGVQELGLVLETIFVSLRTRFNPRRASDPDLVCHLLERNTTRMRHG